jgi:hypothetical protein
MSPHRPRKLSHALPPYQRIYFQFKGLARIAGYTQGSAELTHYFLKGLTKSVLEDVMRGDAPTSYAAIKQKAISCTRSQQLLASLLNRRTPGGFQGGAFGQFQRQQQQCCYRPCRMGVDTDAVHRWYPRHRLPMYDSLLLASYCSQLLRTRYCSPAPFVT